MPVGVAVRHPDQQGAQALHQPQPHRRTGIEDPLGEVTGQTLEDGPVSAEDELAESRHRHGPHSGLTVAEIASQRGSQAGALEAQHLLVVLSQPPHQHGRDLLHLGALVSQGAHQDVHQVLGIH